MQRVAQHQRVACGAVPVIGRVQVLREQVAREAPANAKIRKPADWPDRAWRQWEKQILDLNTVSKLVRVKLIVEAAALKNGQQRCAHEEAPRQIRLKRKVHGHEPAVVASSLKLGPGSVFGSQSLGSRRPA